MAFLLVTSEAAHTPQTCGSSISMGADRDRNAPLRRKTLRGGGDTALRARPTGTSTALLTKGMVTTAAHALFWCEPQDQLVDLLSERLRFEQNSVRLHEALIVKLELHGELVGGPARSDVVEIRNESLAQVRLLAARITDLGCDPAAVNIPASREVVASRGIGDIVIDRSTTILDALDVLLFAELTDHEQWVELVELACDINRADLAQSFLTAQSTKHKHLAKMRSWILALRTACRVEVQ